MFSNDDMAGCSSKNQFSSVDKCYMYSTLITVNTLNYYLFVGC